MLALLAELLTLGIAIAMSPLAIVAVILMATAGKGRTNGTAFIVGSYTFAVVFVGVLVLLGRASGAESDEPGPRTAIGIVELVLGGFLLVLAVMQWNKRSEHGTPRWMTGLDGLSVWNAFLVGILIAGPLSPKDLPLLISASGRIARSALPDGEVVTVILVFGLFGIAAVMVPWFISVTSPLSVEKRLSGMRTWLVDNHAVIMVVLFVILGFKMIGSGVADLAGSA